MTPSRGARRRVPITARMGRPNEVMSGTKPVPSSRAFGCEHAIVNADGRSTMKIRVQHQSPQGLPEAS